jgi:hypothetical protein
MHNRSSIESYISPLNSYIFLRWDRQPPVIMQMHFLAFLFMCLLGSVATAIPTTANAVIEWTEASSSESSPNPIASLYPFNVTGTINSTISVVPIPYKLARSIIPSQYGILTKAYEELLPGFPPNSYPVRSLHRPENLDRY